MDFYTVDAEDLNEFMVRKIKNTANETKNNNYFGYVTKICFKETLDIIDADGRIIGEFTAKIRESYSDLASRSLIISVHSSKMYEGNKDIEMSLITNCTIDFHTFEEKWSQLSKNQCKTLMISRSSNEKTINVNVTSNNDELLDQKRIIPIEFTEKMLTEGMNVAYMRYLAIIGYNGTIHNKAAISINGKLYKAIYVCSSEDSHQINSVCIPVYIIKRTLYRDGMPQSQNIDMTSVLSRAGYLLEHSWNMHESSRKMKIPKSLVVMDNGEMCMDSLINLRNNWERDIRFKSLYLDKVTEIKSQYNSYLKNNVLVKEMIVDYIKEVLSIKPENVLKFSIEYFENIQEK
ncbi:ciliogenesis-associated TTC17-interacting protein-like [Adelges cooleyi]|uniref:ciliogenesis-associated TTC17-interacting protein-like n=1 Tax=Adelges cooleyi TaxID=133065 RepID=UPI00218010B4|nr:ciliogenesis-associated TTC17-interacting protein-like [Adelges cooleyi]